MSPPTDTIEIVEILGPSEQGFQKPYQCRGEDGLLYYVKGRQTNRASLWLEWVCAILARHIGLNVPPFRLVHVSQELLDEAPIEWRDLGAGIAFGSQKHAVSVWLEPCLFGRVPVAVQRDVLAFDWWIRNTDRQNGNSNLLWDPVQNCLLVIDHNMAFDQAFTSESFLENHVFSAQWREIVQDMFISKDYENRFTKAFIDCFDEACNNGPEEWRWANPECDVPAKIDLDGLRALLLRCTTPELWRSV